MSRLGDQENVQIDFNNKKRSIKLFFAGFFTMAAVMNVLFAWALPNTIVECAQDIFIEYLNNAFEGYQNYKNSTFILILFFLSSDFIFLSTIYKHILQRGDVNFTYKLISLIFTKIIIDLTFFHYNIYNSFEYETIVYFSLTNYISKHSNSLFSLSIAIQVLCSLQNFRRSSKLFKIYLILNLALNSFYYLFSNIFFTFQIIFSFLIADYINRLFDK